MRGREAGTFKLPCTPETHKEGKGLGLDTRREEDVRHETAAVSDYKGTPDPQDVVSTPSNTHHWAEFNLP